HRYPLGLYRFNVPSRKYLEEVDYWTLTGNSQEWLLATDTPGTFLADTTTPALDIVKAILRNKGVPDQMIIFPQDDKKLSTPLRFDAAEDEEGATYLRICNGILNAVGYRALWTDNDGVFRTRKISSSAAEAPAFVYGRE